MTIEELQEKRDQITSLLATYQRDIAFYEGKLAVIDEMLEQLRQEQFIAELSEEYAKPLQMLDDIERSRAEGIEDA